MVDGVTKNKLISSLNDSLGNIFYVKTLYIASVPVRTQVSLDMSVTGYTVVSVRVQNADNVTTLAIGKNQTLYVKYDNGFAYSNIEVFAYYVKNDYLHTLS